VKYGLEGRDADITVEKENLRVLSACGLNSKDRPGFCYTTNFMTPFDWFRTHMDFELPDGSKAMAIQTELVAMFDRYVLDIEPQTSGYYEARYGSEVMKNAETLWRDTFGENPDAGFVIGKVRTTYNDKTRRFIDDMLKGKAGSSEAQGFTLDTFRQQVRDARYMGQPKDTACFENDRDGTVAHNALQEHQRYYGNELAATVRDSGVPVVLHPDDTTSTKGGRGDLGVPRVASTAEDILHMYESHIGMNLCTGCFGSSMLVNCEADIIADAIKLIREKHQDADLTGMYPFLHLRKVLRGDEDLSNYNSNPEVQTYLKKIQADLGGHAESIAELPHHVSLTPLFKTLQVLHKENMLWDIRPDHAPSLAFHMDYKTGNFTEEQLGQPGYDQSRIMSAQQIRIMLDAMYNLEEQTARQFVTHFENKLCAFGLNADGDRKRLGYLHELDFGKALMEFVRTQDFEPVFSNKVSPQVAQAIVSGQPVEATVTMLTEERRVAAANVRAA
jgi:D-mannonate dehydratase